MRVILTRPDPAGAESAEALAARGFEVIRAPVIAVAPTGAPPPDGPFAALAVTSRNGADEIGRRLAAGDLAGTSIGALPAYAVGPRTAEALRQAGFAEVHVADGDGRDLTRLMLSRLRPSEAPVLVASGVDRKRDLTQGLAAAGFGVALWMVYEARGLAAWPDAAAEALGGTEPPAVLHYSRRSAELFRRLLRDRRPIGEFFHVCLSQDVARALEGRVPAERIAIADRPEEAALIAALETLRARQGLHRRGGTRQGAGPTGEPAQAGEWRDAQSMSQNRKRGKAPAAEKETVRPADMAEAPAATPIEEPAVEASAVEQAAAPTELAADIEAARPVEAVANPDIAEPPIEPPIEPPAVPPEAPAAPEPVEPAAYRVVPEAEAAKAEPSAVASSEPAPARSGFGAAALAGAGLIGGVAGAVLALLVGSGRIPGLERPTPEPPPPLADSALQARLTALEGEARAAREAAGQSGQAAQARAQEVSAQAQEASERAAAAAAAIQALEGRVSALSAAPGAPPIDETALLAPVRAELERLASGAAAAATQRAEADAALEARIEALQTRIDAVEASARELARPSAATAAATQLSLLDRAQQAFAAGRPFTAEVEALVATGVPEAEVAPLRPFAAGTGLSIAALDAQFRQLRAQLSEETRSSSPDWTERLLRFTDGLVRVRPVGEVAGTSPAALTARIEQALERGSAAEAHVAWQALPEPARRASATFGDALVGRGQAETALRTLSERAVANLAPAR